MLVEASPSVGIESVKRGALAEVGLDRADAHFKQFTEMALIPFHSLGIREVEDGVLVRHRSVGVAHHEVFVDQLVVERIVLGEVGQLPQTDVESVVKQVLDHLLRVGEAVLGKLVVALPVHAEPSGVEVDDVGRDAVLAKF